MGSKNSERIKTIVFPLGFLIFFLGMWEWIAVVGNINHLILPPFSEVVAAAITNFGELSFHLGITALESVLGFLVGVLGAFALAVLFVNSKSIKNMFLPFAIALKATPLIALAPLVILWFGNDLTSKIAMGAMVAFFPVLINSIEGLTNIEKEKINLFKSYSASKLQTLLKLRIPHSVPFVFASLKIASTLAVVGVVIAEFTGANMGLGFVIINASYYLNSPLMFAAILLISVWGILFYLAISALERILTKRYY